MSAYHHDRYFNVVTWEGQRHFFNETQAPFIQKLWEAYLDGEEALHADDLRKRVGEIQTMARAFRNHPAVGNVFTYLKQPKGWVALNVKPGNLLVR